MNSFANAVKNVQLETRTANGMKTFDSSKNDLVDLFFMIGASRGKDLSVPFTKALKEDELLALRMLMWARDVRGGAGEREVVRKVLVHLEKTYPKALDRILPHLSEFGRWDDLLVFQSKEFKTKAYTLIGNALREKNGLAAKWMPRKGTIAREIREFFGMSPKFYRKSLVSLTKVVEQNMCSGDWSNIEYSHVPSLAAARYQKAFNKHDPEGYAKYKAKLTTGEAKVNAGAVYPYDVIKSRRFGGDDTVIQAQWDALPCYIGDELVLPVCDVSGSMGSPMKCGLTYAEAAAAMAMVAMRTEDACIPMGFDSKFKALPLSRRMRLDTVLQHTQSRTFGRTDCAQPMLHALEFGLKVDAFVVYTDCETWYGNIHPAQALRRYRERTGIDAKLVVMGMAGNRFTIADPTDRGMLDVVGFDASAPVAVETFLRG